MPTPLSHTQKKRMRKSQAPSVVAKRQKVSRKKATTQNKFVRYQSLAPGVVTNAGFPPTMLVAHRYYDTITALTSGAAKNGYTISCNGMYDPNISGVGHQPMYFDTFTGIYNHYRVLSSKIKWTVVGTSAAGLTVPIRCGVFISDDTAAFTALQAMEHRTGQTSILAASLQSKVIFNQQWSLAENFPRQKFDDELKGSSSANPAEQMYYSFHVQPMDETTASSINFTIEVEYFAEWSELKDAVTS